MSAKDPHARLLEALHALIEVVDNCDYALDSLQDHPQSAYRHGMMMILRSALKRSQALGLEDYTVLDGKFDPTYHEAVAIAKEGNRGEIQRVMRRGWTFDSKTIRHAQVVVYEGGIAQEKGAQEDEDDTSTGGRRRRR